MSVCNSSGSGIQLGQKQEQQRSEVAESCSPRHSPPNGFTTKVSLWGVFHISYALWLFPPDSCSKITWVCLYNWIYVKSLGLRWMVYMGHCLGLLTRNLEVCGFNVCWILIFFSPLNLMAGLLIAVENEMYHFLLYLISFLFFHISQPPLATPATSIHHLHSTVITAPRTKTLLDMRRLSNRLGHFRLLCR